MLALFALALALSADAFAVALAQGAATRSHLFSTALVIALAFGAAQAIMPLAGWALGLAFTHAIAAFDHWIAFAILAVLGLKSIREGLSEKAEPLAHVGAWPLATMALATSIDAAAAGLTLPTLDVAPVFAAGVIGLVTAVVCMGGVYLGRVASAKLGGAAEVVAGAALIAIGGHILWEHGAFVG